MSTPLDKNFARWTELARGEESRCWHSLTFASEHLGIGPHEVIARALAIKNSGGLHGLVQWIDGKPLFAVPMIAAIEAAMLAERGVQVVP